MHRIVLLSGKGLYVVMDNWSSPTGLMLYLLGLEGQPDEKVPTWKVRPIHRPTAQAEQAATAKMGRFIPVSGHSRRKAG